MQRGPFENRVIWAAHGSRLLLFVNGAMQSTDLGQVSVDEAQKLAWMRRAKLIGAGKNRAILTHDT